MRSCKGLFPVVKFFGCWLSPIGGRGNQHDSEPKAAWVVIRPVAVGHAVEGESMAKSTAENKTAPEKKAASEKKAAVAASSAFSKGAAKPAASKSAASK